VPLPCRSSISRSPPAMQTQHIALAIGEEVDLHTPLLDDLDEEVDVTQSRMKATTLKVCVCTWRTGHSFRCRGCASGHRRGALTPTRSLSALLSSELLSSELPSTAGGVRSQKRPTVHRQEKCK